MWKKDHQTDKGQRQQLQKGENKEESWSHTLWQFQFYMEMSKSHTAKEKPIPIMNLSKDSLTF